MNNRQIRRTGELDEAMRAGGRSWAMRINRGGQIINHPCCGADPVSDLFASAGLDKDLARAAG